MKKILLALVIIAGIAAGTGVITKLDNRKVDFAGSQLSFNAQSSLTNEDGQWGISGSALQTLAKQAAGDGSALTNGGGGAQVWTNDVGQFRIVGQSNSINFVVAPNISSNSYDGPLLELTGGTPNAGAIGDFRGDVVHLESRDPRQSIAAMGVDYDQPWIELSMGGNAYANAFQDITIMDGMQNFSDKPYYFNTGTNEVSANSIHTAFANAGTNVVDVYGQGVVSIKSGLLVHSNTLASIPTLAKGDNYYFSSNGVAYVICSSPSGVLTTNKLGP